MVRTNFSPDEVLSTLTSHGFVPVDGGGKGSHVKLRYGHPKTDEVRVVIVPDRNPIPVGTLQSIAEQAGADERGEHLS